MERNTGSKTHPHRRTFIVLFVTFLLMTSIAQADTAARIYDLLDYDARASVTYDQLQSMHGDYRIEERELIAGFRQHLIDAITRQYTSEERSRIVQFIIEHHGPPEYVSAWLTTQVIKSLFWFSREGATIMYRPPD